MSENDHGPFLNTDRELWREPPGDYYANSIHVTEHGGIGINVGGMVFVKSLRGWHELAKDAAAAEERGRRRGEAERDELRDRMHQTIAFLLSCVASGEKLSDEEEAGIRVMLREGLAPRVPHASEGPPCAGCGHAKWRHQYSSKEHAFCSEPIGREYCQCKNYLAPRDSAPVTRSLDPDADCDCGTDNMAHKKFCTALKPRDSREEAT